MLYVPETWIVHIVNNKLQYIIVIHAPIPIKFLRIAAERKTEDVKFAIHFVHMWKFGARFKLVAR